MYDYAKFMAELERKNPAQPEFIQAAGEIIASVIDTVNSNPLYLKNKILDRITEPIAPGITTSELSYISPDSLIVF